MVIQSKKVWLADQFVPAAIEVNDGRITAILPYGTKDVDDDYGDKRIVPGFMDIHCHGAYEFDTNDANEDGLRYWAEHIVSEGVTSFLATTITQSVEVLTNAVTNVANVMESGYDGAEILGIHFEGPYLDMKYKGAQPDQYIVKPTIEQFEHYQKAARGHIRYVTLATEHDEDFALTRYLTAHGVVVSIGHSGATYEQAVMAYANGARSMTHVYNGMSPFNHRANGLVGAAYRIRTMYGEIICDGCHSTPAALNNYFMSKGPDYAIMVSDALMAKGTPVGSKYLFGGNEIIIYPDGSAHLTATGGLAGSTLNINKGLRILVEEALVPFNYALNSCTINPAKCLHLDDRKGSIQVGKDADLVVLEDNYDVLQTYCMGQPKLGQHQPARCGGFIHAFAQQLHGHPAQARKQGHGPGKAAHGEETELEVTADGQQQRGKARHTHAQHGQRCRLEPAHIAADDAQRRHLRQLQHRRQAKGQQKCEAHAQAKGHGPQAGRGQGRFDQARQQQHKHVVHQVTHRHAQRAGKYANERKFGGVGARNGALALAQHAQHGRCVQVVGRKAARGQRHGHGRKQRGQQGHQAQELLCAVQRLAHFGAAAFQRFHPHGAHVGLFDLFSRPF